jgi:hypothetical protein
MYLRLDGPEKENPAEAGFSALPNNPEIEVRIVPVSQRYLGHYGRFSIGQRTPVKNKGSSWKRVGER